MNHREMTIRRLSSVSEMRVCIALQKKIWGYADLDIVPDHIFVVAAKTGGQVLAAFDAETPVGFSLAFLPFARIRFTSIPILLRSFLNTKTVVLAAGSSLRNATELLPAALI